MLVAAFAVGRAQQLIYLLQVLKSEGRIPELPIYLDSPMACDATMIYREHREDHDLSEGELDPANPVLDGRGVAALPHDRRIEAPQPRRRPGRHHLQQRHDDRRPHSASPEAAAAQRPEHGRSWAASWRTARAAGMLQDGAKWLRMHGQDVPVRAAIEASPRPQRPRRSQRAVALAAASQPAQSSLPRPRRSAQRRSPRRDASPAARLEGPHARAWRIARTGVAHAAHRLRSVVSGEYNNPALAALTMMVCHCLRSTNPA